MCVHTVVCCLVKLRRIKSYPFSNTRLLDNAFLFGSKPCWGTVQTKLFG
ncbi:hypothetical protein EG68_12313 [Paragonimus skrjabini miyazakii]|uniref:Uncharacterized protein n=1 Tax=Paragonimus skrjabini miyazakii TaxID=59628 RepID=A0A8S9YHM2_9TREM|nr:hypothetical protein EG68_12313 [Paragonimus skrjabini miyazakii]